MEPYKAQRLAEAEMYAHGLIQSGWTFKWDRAVGRNGQTRYVQKEIGLSLPTVQLREEEWVRMTIIHEIAHALVGPGHGHGAIWKRKFRELGGDGSRCSQDRVDTSSLAKYEVRCAITQKVLGRAMRKGKRLAVSVCTCHRVAPEWITLR